MKTGVGESASAPLQLAVSVDEAAQALGVSRRHFERHIARHLRLVPAGETGTRSVRELERYLDERAA